MVKISETAIVPTQAKILQSAKEIFMAKGMDGARMQEIADHAGINKALVHYYFRNKETLFHAVFSQAIQELLPALTEVFRSNRPLLEKIPDFFSLHIKFIQDNPMVPYFILSEINRNPEIILKGFRASNQEGLFEKFVNDVNVSIQNGEIQPIDPKQLLINLLALSVFPFIARPLLEKVFGMEDNRYEQLLEERKAEVTKFVIHALK